MADEKRSNEYSEANDQTTEMNGMMECLNFLNRKGYTGQFKVEDKKLISLSDDRRYDVKEVTAMNF